MVRIKLVLMAMIMGIVCVPPRVQAAETHAVLKNIRVIESGDILGVEISADKDLEYTCYKMPEFYRIVVDLPRTEPGRADTIFRVKSTRISNIKVQKKRINDIPLTRVSVTLDEDADFTVRVDPADKRKLTVYFSKVKSVPAAGATAPKQEKHATAAPSAGGKPPVPAAPAAKPMLKSVVPGVRQPITVGKVTFSADAIDIQTDGFVKEFKAFTLREPGRLVIDIPAAQSALSTIAVPANRFGIVTARIGYFEGKLRLVFDAGQKPFPAYNVLATTEGLRVVPAATK